VHHVGFTVPIFLSSLILYPNYLLHPSPIHFSTFQVFLIHFRKCAISSTTQIYTPNSSFLKYKSKSLVKTVFMLMLLLPRPPGYNVPCVSCSICYQATQTAEIFYSLQLFWSIITCVWDGCLETLVTLDQRFPNCGPRTTGSPRVLPLWSS
jgi:hypothetical protein